MSARVAAGVLVLAVTCAACGGKKQPGAAAGADAGVGTQASAAADAAAAAPDPGEPTRAECEQAISNMQRIAPGLVPGDAVDLEDCLKLPRALVVCLHGAKSSEDTNKCVDLAASAGGAGGAEAAARGPDAPGDPDRPGDPDEPPASLAECRAMVAHYRSLVPEDERDEAPEAGMLAACTKELTSKEAACVLDARTLEAAETCLNGG